MIDRHLVITSPGDMASTIDCARASWPCRRPRSTPCWARLAGAGADIWGGMIFDARDRAFATRSWAPSRSGSPSRLRPRCGSRSTSALPSPTSRAGRSRWCRCNTCWSSGRAALPGAPGGLGRGSRRLGSPRPGPRPDPPRASWPGRRVDSATSSAVTSDRRQPPRLDTPGHSPDPAVVVPPEPTAAGTPLRIGRYEVIGHLATGGMAQIYLARTTGLGSFERHVVLKTILRERAQDQRFVTMFLDEAKLAATLNHQNVAQVYEVDQADGAYFMAMEYVHGENARAILETALRARLDGAARARRDHRGRRGGRACTTRTSARARTASRSASSTATCRRRTSWSARRQREAARLRHREGGGARDQDAPPARSRASTATCRPSSARASRSIAAATSSRSASACTSSRRCAARSRATTTSRR